MGTVSSDIDWTPVLDAAREIMQAVAEFPAALERRERMRRCHAEYRRRQRARARRRH